MRLRNEKETLAVTTEDWWGGHCVVISCQTELISQKEKLHMQPWEIQLIVHGAVVGSCAPQQRDQPLEEILRRTVRLSA